MPLSLLKKNDLKLLAQDVTEGVQRFVEHVEPFRLRWITERIQVVRWPREAFRIPAIQAHRGHWTTGAAQNTLESLKAAREAGARMAEFDVRVTYDRIVVLFHDADLEIVDRQDLRVHELTFSELKTAVAGLFRLVTLREVLASIEVPDYLNIEIKSEQVLNDPLERLVAEAVKAAGAEGRVMFSSFNPFSIWKMSNLLPQVPRAFLVSRDTESRSLREMWFAPFLKIHMLNLDKEMVTEASMRMWRKLNVPIGVWTIKDNAEIEHYLKLGVSSVISDFMPESLMDVES